MTKKRMPQKSLYAVSEMLFATVIWGFGFTASIWAIKSFSPFAISFIRFGAAFLLAAPLIFFNQEFRSEFNFRSFKLAMIPGWLLGSMLILQTWGLEYTTATKSGFITTLYVVIVPMIEVFINNKKLHRTHVLWVFLALVGTAFMVDLNTRTLSESGFNKGDLLTLLCAFVGAAQISFMGRVSPQVNSAFIFNAFQSFWAAVLSLVTVLAFSGPHWKGYDSLAFLGLFSLTIGSTMIAFALQVKAQKTLSPSLSSILFLLESPFAMMFGILLLHEKLSFSQTIGAILIFLSAYGAVHFERLMTKKT